MSSHKENLTSNNPNKNTTPTLDRRKFGALTLGAGATLLLTACGESTQSKEVAAAPDHEASAEMPIERLGIDVDDLPLDVNLYADREECNPERFRDIRINDGLEPFIREFQTMKADVLTSDGELDVQKAVTSFVGSLEAGLNYGCDKESLRPFVDFPDDGSFVDELSRDDVHIVRGIAGYPLEVASDAQLMEMEIFKQFHAAHRATLGRYISNAQRPGGDLNTTTRITSSGYEVAELQNSEKYKWATINMVVDRGESVDTPPIDGHIGAVMYYKEDGIDTVVYKVETVYGPQQTPLEQLAVS